MLLTTNMLHTEPDLAGVSGQSALPKWKEMKYGKYRPGTNWTNGSCSGSRMVPRDFSCLVFILGQFVRCFNSGVVPTISPPTFW